MVGSLIAIIILLAGFFGGIFSAIERTALFQARAEPYGALWIATLVLLFPIVVGWRDVPRSAGSTIDIYLWGHAVVLLTVLQTRVIGDPLGWLLPMFWAGYVILTMTIWSYLPTLQRAWSGTRLEMVLGQAGPKFPRRAWPHWFIFASIVSGTFAVLVSLVAIWTQPNTDIRASASVAIIGLAAAAWLSTRRIGGLKPVVWTVELATLAVLSYVWSTLPVPSDIPRLLNRLAATIITLAVSGVFWFGTATVFHKGRWQDGLRFAIFLVLWMIFFSILLLGHLTFTTHLFIY